MSDIVAEARRVAGKWSHHSDPQRVLAADLLRQLADIVEKLPVTADGVLVLPGMELFYINPCEQIDECVVRRAWEKSQHTNPAGPYPCYQSEHSCYSTREAADRSRQ